MKIHLFTKIAIALFSVMIVYIMRNLLKALTEGGNNVCKFIKGESRRVKKNCFRWKNNSAENEDGGKEMKKSCQGTEASSCWQQATPYFIHIPAFGGRDNSLSVYGRGPLKR